MKFFCINIMCALYGRAVKCNLIVGHKFVVSRMAKCVLKNYAKHLFHSCPTNFPNMKYLKHHILGVRVTHMILASIFTCSGNALLCGSTNTALNRFSIIAYSNNNLLIYFVAFKHFSCLQQL